MRAFMVVVVLLSGLSMTLGLFSVQTVPNACADGSYLPHAPMRILSDADLSIDVSMATSVTVFEQTGEVSEYTFDLYTLMHGGGVFYTVAMLVEMYTVSSDGVYLTIHCYRVPPYPCSGYGVGNNIVAARLNGVAGYPQGIWASYIVGYTLGVEGTAESRFNALGNDTQLGPYANSLCTYMGDYDSELVLGFSTPGPPPPPPIEASLDFDMDTWNPASEGKWVTAYIGLPIGYSVEDINLSSVMLNEIVPASGPWEIKDFDHDKSLELMVKFDRGAALLALGGTESVTVTVTGLLINGTHFQGSDVITVKTEKKSSIAMLDSVLVGLMTDPATAALVVMSLLTLSVMVVSGMRAAKRNIPQDVSGRRRSL